MNKSILVKSIANTKFSQLSEEKLADIWAIIKQPEEEKERCPNCNSFKIASFSSLQEKLCTDCGTKLDWKLKENQKPLIKYQR